MWIALLALALFSQLLSAAAPTPGSSTAFAQTSAEGAVPDTTLADFVERDFPFLTVTIDADTLAPHVPDHNWAVRGVVVALGDSTYFAFDPDLLRMSLAWEGEFISLRTMAMVSYHQLDKANGQPRVLGRPIAGTGMYPGWDHRSSARHDLSAERQHHRLSWVDPREPGQDPDLPGKGPLPDSIGTYKGLYVDGSDVVFAYDVGGAEVFERPQRLDVSGSAAVSRTLKLLPSTKQLRLVAAEIPNAVVSGAGREIIFRHDESSHATVVRLDGQAAALDLADGNRAWVRVPPHRDTTLVRVSIWTGPVSDIPSFRDALAEDAVRWSDDFLDGGPARWSQQIRTAMHVAPDSSTFVFDTIELPHDNPWRRNVRPADIDFFSDGRAAILTFDGDVWIVDGIDAGLPVWKRFASGLFEPLSLTVADDTIIAYGREGLVKLHDLNGDAEADFYQAFAPGIVYSSRTREWPFDVVERPDGGFYVSQGGALHSPSTRHLEPMVRGFLGGSKHNGTILSVSPDGRDIEVYATGFRAPTIGIHPKTGALTASDQQGNFVPTTPIYGIAENGFYGVPATAHRMDPIPEPLPPITWIPHQVDPSGSTQIWATSEKLGPLNGSMIHVSYGRPGLLRVYVDSAAAPMQGAVTPLPFPPEVPLLKAEVNPGDGLIYTAGFQVYGSRAAALAGIVRMRYTEGNAHFPRRVLAGQRGIVIAFDDALHPPNPDSITVRRWNYRRTEAYGSGHFRLDGTEGEEHLPVAAAQLSSDRRSIHLALPDMQEVMQMAVDLQLRTEDGEAIRRSIYLTVNDVRNLDLAALGFENPIPELAQPVRTRPLQETPRAAPTAAAGRHLYDELGCAGCHSLDGSKQGNLGPTFAGLYDSERRLEGGSVRRADAEYLREAILNPAAAVVEGYDAEMPPFRGILSSHDVESLILFIRSLETDSAK